MPPKSQRHLPPGFEAPSGDPSGWTRTLQPAWPFCKPRPALRAIMDPQMFTGIVEATGSLAGREVRGPGARLSITRAGGLFATPLVLGESIAVHGVCLTVQTTTADGFWCDATGETLARTTLGSIPIGGRVHLERALAVGDRLGGHIVTGHIDGKVVVRERQKLGDAWKLVFEIAD